MITELRVPLSLDSSWGLNKGCLGFRVQVLGLGVEGLGLKAYRV